MNQEELQRLIYRCMMGKGVVIIASNDEHASERFKEFREAFVATEDELRTILKKTEREIIYGQRSEQEVIGIFEAQEAISAMGVGFHEEAEKMYEAFIGTFIPREPIGISVELYDIDDVLEEVHVYNPLLKPFRRIWREKHNNYPKLHAFPVISRLRCRWRPRESRKSLDGLSPGVVVIDEMHEWS